MNAELFREYDGLIGLTMVNLYSLSKANKQIELGGFNRKNREHLFLLRVALLTETIHKIPVYVQCSIWDWIWINLKEGKALVDALRANGVNAQLQFTDMKSQDLNAAGRIANKSNPYLYVSIHHNYYDSNAKGYFAMYNPNDNNSKIVADRLSNAISNNGLVKQRESQQNTGYIGELNALNKSTTGVLLELGFFSNGSELKNICSDNYVNYVSNKLADELTKILNEQYR